MTETIAFLDGWHAQCRGLSFENNPYHPATQGQSHREWDRGWHDRRSRTRVLIVPTDDVVALDATALNPN